MQGRDLCSVLLVTQHTVYYPLSLQESLLEEGADKTFYGSDEDEDEDEEEKEKKAEATAMAKRKPYVMDPDHRLLLRNTKPLLQSRNAAVRPLHFLITHTLHQFNTAQHVNSSFHVAVVDIMFSLHYSTIEHQVVVSASGNKHQSSSSVPEQNT